MILYHFTYPAAWEAIQREGRIRTTESNIGSGRADWPPMGEHVGPDVVHLTDTPDLAPKAAGLHYSPEHVHAILTAGLQVPDKMAVRLTLDLDDGEPERWRDFARRHGINRKWRRVLEQGRRPETWWVLERPVSLDEIRDVTIRDEATRKGTDE